MSETNAGGMLLSPAEIEKRSMEIIEEELAVSLPEETRPIVKRVIHATADFSFAESLRFSPGVVERIRGMLRGGATVITDTNMALAGINKASLRGLGASALCFMAEEDVARAAKERGITRAAVSMEKALERPGPKLLVCGNAPTFLLPLLREREEARAAGSPGKEPPASGAEIAVIGVPVGFVNVVEVKERLWASGLPCIVAMGRRGGSTVAAAIVNALLYETGGLSDRPPDPLRRMY